MKIKKILIVAGIIATIMSLTVSIYAYSTQPTAGSQYRLEGGIQSQEYYIYQQIITPRHIHLPFKPL